MLAELGGEAVTRPLRRSAADGVAERGVLRDQARGARPGWQAVNRLDQGCADQHGRAEAGAAGPAQFVKIRYELPDLGEIEQRADAVRVMRVCYV